jgi:hypothetical protein
MPTYEIRHNWNATQSQTVVGKVEGAIAMAKQGKIPVGFRPISIVAVPGQTEAHCLWEAPSAESLESLYRQIELPTTRTIREVKPFFTA